MYQTSFAIAAGFLNKNGTRPAHKLPTNKTLQNRIASGYLSVVVQT